MDNKYGCITLRGVKDFETPAKTEARSGPAITRAGEFNAALTQSAAPIDYETRERLRRIEALLQPAPPKAGEKGGGPKGALAAVLEGDADSKSLRKAAVTALQRECRRAGKPLTHKDIYCEAGYSDKCEFYRWRRADPKTTKSADRNIRRAMRELLKSL